MTKYLSNLCLLIFIACFLSSCSTFSPPPLCDVKNSNGDCKVNGMTYQEIRGGKFLIATYQKITSPKEPYVFYIEGDGAAFFGRGRISSNPTPRTRMMLNLASIDTRPNVVYIARPCQYVPMDKNPECNNEYWTDKRMSEEVISSINEVIINLNNNQKFSLVGYSGGGAVAVLISARNDMVKDVLTIAGNLDHREFTESHKALPMKGSLNPIDYSKEVANIPQLHLSGEKDNIVKPFIAEKYVKRVNNHQTGQYCAKHKVFESVTHAKGWEKIWSQLHLTPIMCTKIYE